MPNRTICLINDSFPPVTDGVANAVVNYARVITESGSTAVVATPAYPGTMVPFYDQLLLGGLLFGAVFMATDPVTACRTNTGKYIYGAFIGIVAVIIRNYNTGYPEGAMLAILLANVLAPLIDWCVVQANVSRRMRRLVAIEKKED